MDAGQSRLSTCNGAAAAYLNVVMENMTGVRLVRISAVVVVYHLIRHGL